MSDPVLPAEPLQLLQSGQYNKVPLIVGTNRDEGLLIKVSRTWEESARQKNYLVLDVN